MPDRSVVIRLRAEVSQFKRSLGEAKQSVDQLTKADLKKPSDAFDSLASKSALAGAAVAVGVGLAVKSFADFDKQMSAASAATDTTGEALEQLRAAAIKSGADTQFSATEAASAITEMGKAGVSATDILGGGLTGALSLAAAGQLDVGSAGEIAATALNQFGLAGKDIPHVADLLAAGAGKAQGSVTDLSTALNYVGPVAHSMGISIEESVGILAEFASAGLVGEQGGTAFRGMLSSLLSPSEAASKTMQKLGINLYDANGQFIGMQATAQVLHDRLGGLDEATRNAALGQIFGNAQLAAATVLYQGGGAAVADWTAKVNDQGFATEQAAKLMDNLSGDIEKFSGSVETAFIQAGSGGNDVLRGLVQGATEVVNSIGGIPGPVLLAGTALGALALAGPKAFLSFRQYRQDLDNAGISLGKITEKAPRVGKSLDIASKGVKGLTVALTGLAVASHAFSDDMDQLGTEQLVKQLSSGADTIKSLDAAFSKATGTGTDFDSNVRGIGDALRYTFNHSTADEIDNTAGSIFSLVGGRNTSDMKVAADRLKEVDGALATMVSSGNGDRAAEIMKDISREAQAQGISVDDLKAKFPQYAESLAAIANNGPAAKVAIDGVTESQDAMRDKAEKAADANDKLLDSISAFQDKILNARSSRRDFEQAVDDAQGRVKKRADLQAQIAKLQKDPKKNAEEIARLTEELQKYAATLDYGTEAGRNNEAALDKIADTTLKGVKNTFAARDANTSLADAVRIAEDQVSQGRTEFVKYAQQMGLNEADANKLADQLKLTKDNVDQLSQTVQQSDLNKSGVVTVDTSTIAPKIEGAKRKLDEFGDYKGPAPAVTANTDPVYTSIDGVNGALYQLSLQKTEPTVNANDLASGKIGNIQTLLGGLHDKTVTVAINETYSTTGLYANKPVPVTEFRATGGPIVGPGSGTSDTAGVYALSNGEHIFTDAEVRAAGGHGNIFRLRKALLAGGVQFAAAGGPAQAPTFMGASSQMWAGPSSHTVTYRTEAPVNIEKVVAADLQDIERKAAYQRRRLNSGAGQGG